MSQTECQMCAKKLVDNAYVCKPCHKRLERNLSEVVSLVFEVETATLRQARMSKGSIGIVIHAPEEYDLLPNERPRLALRELVEVLRGYVAIVVSTRGVTTPVDSPLHTSRFLLRHTEWLRHREDAADAQREIEWAIHNLRRTIDLPADRVFAGPCGAVDYACTLDHNHTENASDCDSQPVVGSPPCTGSVFGRRNSRTATCDTCGCEHLMEDRREWLLKAVEDQLDYAARLSQALSNLGRDVKPELIRKWAERGRLVAHGHDDKGRPLYRVGDVIDLLAGDALRQSKEKAS